MGKEVQQWSAEYSFPTDGRGPAPNRRTLKGGGHDSFSPEGGPGTFGPGDPRPVRESRVGFLSLRDGGAGLSPHSSGLP